MIPGELLPAEGEIELNTGKATATLTVANTGDRPIQIGSHFHFYEVNAPSVLTETKRGECAWIFQRAPLSALNQGMSAPLP